MQENRVTVAGNQMKVELAGNIYVAEAAVLRELLFGYVHKGQKKLTIDFTEVEYIDSSTLGALVAVQKQAKQNGGGVVVTGLHGLAKELFEMTRLTKVFEII
jgi:anti-sigma B factor antagonist